MTLTQFQTALHYLYQGDTDVPTSTEDDWTIRITLLESAIEAWYAEEGILWRELWKTASGTTSGTSISLPSDFRKPGGFLRIKEDDTNWSYWPIVSPEKSELIKNVTTKPKFGYITGNEADGFTLYLSVNPGSHSYEMPYYKDPAYPDAAAEVIEMSDPWFAIYFALAKLHELDGEGDRAGLALGQASVRLKAMRVRNEIAAPYQENYVPDRDIELGTGGFGE